MEVSILRCRVCGGINRVPRERQGVARCGRCKTELDRSGAPQPVDGARLDATVLGSPVPVLVDFWAAWCGPCRMVKPVLDQLARAQAGKLIAVQLDIDADPEAARRWSVRGVPTFVLFDDGREIGRTSGALPLSALEGWVLRTIGGGVAAHV